MTDEVSSADTTRLMRFVSADPETGCWMWTGSKLGKYAGFQWHGRAHPAHRIAYRAFIGVIPAGLVVMHGCDRMTCVNPAHLSLGTQQDNVDDAVRKGHMSRRAA